MNIKPIIICFTMILPITSGAEQGQTKSKVKQSNSFFSLSEIKNAPKKSLQTLQYIQATDDISLAYRSYLPKHAKAILIFYHGGGAHSGLSYQYIGTGLRDKFDIAVYMPDIRGHGGSDGDRGDTPNVEQVWYDINTIVNNAQDKYPNIPVFIGGHSSGSGLVLNYSSWDKKADIDGYTFLAPYFGYRSDTNYDEEGNADFEFSTVNTSDFVINAMSGGFFLGHAKAVKFNFPDTLLKDNPEIVTFNTVNMANAVTPHSPESQFSNLKKFGLWIGNQDQAFDPLKVIKFAKVNSEADSKNEIKIVDDVNHFSILLNAPDLIGPWLQKTIN